jgi:hypothetical protein
VYRYTEDYYGGWQYGTCDAQCNEIVIVAGRGTKGGYSMYLDAVPQNEE